MSVVYFPGAQKNDEKTLRQDFVDRIISLHYDAIEALDAGRKEDYKHILSNIVHSGVDILQ